MGLGFRLSGSEWIELLKLIVSRPYTFQISDFVTEESMDLDWGRRKRGQGRGEREEGREGVYGLWC